MRHVLLTCRHHPELRWQCKSIAFTPGRGYNGQRSIFFLGRKVGEDEYEEGPALKSDGMFRDECPCLPSDLILAPEEVELQKTEPTYSATGEYIDG